jgi:hypothetical protein
LELCRPLQASQGVYAFTTHGLLLGGLASIRRDLASNITEVPYSFADTYTAKIGKTPLTLANRKVIES